MKIIGGLIFGHFSNNKITTKTVHIDKGYSPHTLCGVNYEKSEILGFPFDGNIEEVTCKRCLKKYRVE